MEDAGGSADPFALPVRQITSDFQKSRQSPDSKIFRLTRWANQLHNSGRLAA
jgi:hypothetical protein